MPAFKSTLSAEQIQALVKHVRSLGKSKTSQK
jgi:mono/diheme cytochrome c family protein